MNNSVLTANIGLTRDLAERESLTPATFVIETLAPGETSAAINQYSANVSSGGPSIFDIPDLAMLLDALTESQFNSGSVSDGDLVEVWTDEYGRDWTKQTDPSRPTYVSDAGDGYPGVNFTTSRLRWIIPAPGTDYLITTGSPFSVFGVIRPTSINAENVILTFEHANGNGSPFIELVGGYLGFQSNNSVWRSFSIGNTISANTTNYFVITYNGGNALDIGNYAVWLNGVSQTLFSSPNGNINGFNLMGDYSSGSGERYRGYIKELAIFDSVLSSDSRDILAAYVARWGL